MFKPADWLVRRTRHAPSPVKTRASRRLGAERLEDRRMLAVLTVSNLDDAGPGSLRDAIATANASVNTPDEIVFQAGLSGTISIASQLPTITDDLTITGESRITIDAGGGTDGQIGNGDGYRLIEVASSVSVTLDGLTLTGGDLNDSNGLGGGAVSNRGELVINRSVIHGNYAGLGGGIENLGRTTINGSVIRDNLARLGGGFFGLDSTVLILTTSTVNGNVAATGGGLYLDSVTLLSLIENSTISGNVATSGDGGGVFSSGTSSGQLLRISNSTIFGNSASGDGGGIAAVENSVELNNSIVTNSLAGGDLFVDCSGNCLSGGFNLIGDGANTSGLSNTLTQPPRLGPLADNGGPTPTHALLLRNQAINFGDPAISSGTDQRGVGFDRVAFGRVDLGAYEVQFSSQGLVVSNDSDIDDGNYTVGELSLREAILLANLRSGPDTITFDISGTIEIGSELPNILEEVVIDGGGRITIDAGGGVDGQIGNGDGYRIVEVRGRRPGDVFDASFIGLTLTGGDSPAGGAVVVAQPNLTISRSTIRDNHGMLFGGGILTGGALTVSNSTLSGNSSSGDGGGIYVSRGVLTVSNSTLSGNSSTGDGGGIFVSSSVSEATVTNSTLHGNSAAINGGGIFAGSTTTLTNSIVANSTSGGDLGGDVSGSFNLIEDGANTAGLGGTVTGDPLLGPLADNGGSTLTHALLPGSPALDAGDIGIADPPAFDQRGVPFVRVVDGNTPADVVIDLGAYEAQAAPARASGDYNGDNTVNAADYTVWRDTLGATGLPPLTGADGDGDGEVTQADYDVWRSHYGFVFSPPLFSAVTTPVDPDPAADATDDRAMAIPAPVVTAIESLSRSAARPGSFTAPQRERFSPAIRREVLLLIDSAADIDVGFSQETAADQMAFSGKSDDEGNKDALDIVFGEL